MKSKLIVPTSDCGDQFIREPKDTCFEVGQVYRYSNGQRITVLYVGSESVLFANRSGNTIDLTLKYLQSNSCQLVLVGVDELNRDTKDQRIKELKSTVLDLQSELSRKKMSLTVACNRVEELEDRLKLSIDTLKNVKRYLPMWGIDTVMDTLKDLGGGVMENKYGLFDDTLNLYARIKELEDKLKIAVACLQRCLDEQWSVDVSDTLEQLGELK